MSFLFAGWDRHHGFQLYESDPAGTFGGWAATVIGANFQVCMSGLRSVVDEVQARVLMCEAVGCVAGRRARAS